VESVVVSRRGEERARRGHPWIYRSDVERGEAPPGAVVRVVGPRGRPLGFAFYSSTSEIRLRLVDRGETLAPGFLAERIAAALAWRRSLLGEPGACRLVHGEADGLPSLIVDRYADVLVVQTLSQGSDRLKEQIVEVLVEQLRPRGILERNDPRVRLLEGLERRTGALWGDVPREVVIREGELDLAVDVWEGQKTGLFLDQLENHAAARAYATGRVLDAFSYTGGFGLQAAARADRVLSVDVSGEALARLARAAAANGLSNVETREANAFDVLRELDDAGERFETIFLDPPAFAKSKAAVPKARRGYKEINLRALRCLSPGGILVTCSCSYNVREPELEEILSHAARDVGASVAVVEKRRQGRDHPVLLAVPETHYLKCFILRRLS
jgi:23S rRNA (cytosine1962-C5)-methyltransferase